MKPTRMCHISKILFTGVFYGISHLFIASYSKSYEEPEFDEMLVNSKEFMEDLRPAYTRTFPTWCTYRSSVNILCVPNCLILTGLLSGKLPGETRQVFLQSVLSGKHIYTVCSPSVSILFNLVTDARLLSEITCQMLFTQGGHGNRYVSFAHISPGWLQAFKHGGAEFIGIKTLDGSTPKVACGLHFGCVEWSNIISGELPGDSSSRQRRPSTLARSVVGVPASSLASPRHLVCLLQIRI